MGVPKLDWKTKTTIILVSGKAGVGKTTFSNLFIKNLPEEVRKYSGKYSFASGIKFAAKVMGWDGLKDERGRKFLQNIGRIGRQYDVNLWVQNMINLIEDINITPLDYIIIDDWRFPNECRWFVERLNEYEVYTVRIYAPNREILKNTPEYNDISETALLEFSDGYYDYFYNNEGTLEELEEQVKSIIYQILEI